MSKKILNIATFGLAGEVFHPFGKDKKPDPNVIDKNQTLISPDMTKMPRRFAPPAPLGQTRGIGDSILSDTLGG